MSRKKNSLEFCDENRANHFTNLISCEKKTAGRVH